MMIAEEALNVRSELKAYLDRENNPIDDSLPIIPEFKGKGEIKLIIIGQDPTIKNIGSRKNISCTLNLNKNNALRSYIERICRLMGITIENVYATNLFKYFYTYPPASTPDVLAAHLQPNLGILIKELEGFGNLPAITLGEPVLRLLTSDNAKVSFYWDYNTKTKKTDGRFTYSKAIDNKLNYDIYPFPHQPSIRKAFYDQTLEVYVSFLIESLRNLD